jgi:hypothetical protein
VVLLIFWSTLGAEYSDLVDSVVVSPNAGAGFITITGRSTISPGVPSVTVLLVTVLLVTIGAVVTVVFDSVVVCGHALPATETINANADTGANKRKILIVSLLQQS